MSTVDKSLENFNRLMESARTTIPFKKPGRDHYQLFGIFHIKPAQGGYAVYRMQDLQHVFSSKVSAASWCILQHHNYPVKSWELVRTDRAYMRMLSNLEYCKHHARGTGFAISLQENRHSDYVAWKKLHKRNLDKLINFAKYIQSKGL